MYVFFFDDLVDSVSVYPMELRLGLGLRIFSNSRLLIKLTELLVRWGPKNEGEDYERSGTVTRIPVVCCFAVDRDKYSYDRCLVNVIRQKSKRSLWYT